MGVFTVTMKTQSREEIKGHEVELNNCIVHHIKPQIFKMIVGKRKETCYTINCAHDDCGKIHDCLTAVIQAWNKWNPKN